LAHSESSGFPLTKVKRIAGKRVRLLKSAIRRVIDTRRPSETVPPNREPMKMANPKKRTIEV
jgi:hypothetical protein